MVEGENLGDNSKVIGRPRVDSRMLEEVLQLIVKRRIDGIDLLLLDLEIATIVDSEVSCLRSFLSEDSSSSLSLRDNVG